MEDAKAKSIVDTLIPKENNPRNATYEYDSFVDQVIREVESLGDYNLFSDGLTIYTTLDPNAQKYTEKMLFTDEIIQYPDEELQAALC